MDFNQNKSALHLQNQHLLSTQNRKPKVKFKILFLSTLGVF